MNTPLRIDERSTINPRPKTVGKSSPSHAVRRLSLRETEVVAASRDRLEHLTAEIVVCLVFWKIKLWREVSIWVLHNSHWAGGTYG